MKIFAIARARPGVSQDEIMPHMPEEAKVAWKLYEQGIIRENYSRTDGPGVVTVFECEDLRAAQQVCDSFPLSQAGLIDFELISVGFFKPYTFLQGDGGETCPAKDAPQIS